MQNYAAHILESTNGAFDTYQKQAQPVFDAVDLSTGEIRLELPAWLTNTLMAGVQNAPLGYIDVHGLLDLRRLYAHALQRQGYALDERNVLITTGAKEAIWLALLAKLVPGSKILLPKPGWPPYRMWAHAFDAVARYYDPRSEDIADAIITALQEHRPSVVILNFPHNPTGTEISQADVQQIIAAATALNVTIVSDEVYQEFSTIDQPGSVLGSISSGGSEVIYINSASKMLGLAGLRIGYIVADPAIVKKLGVVRSSIASCVSSIAQSVLIALLRDQRCEQWMQTIVDRSRACLCYALHGLRDAGYEVESTGAIYAWAKHLALPLQASDDQIVLNERPIQVVSGRTFGTPGYFRLCPVRIGTTLISVFASSMYS